MADAGSERSMGTYKWQMCHAQKRECGAQREIWVYANAPKHVRLRIVGKMWGGVAQERWANMRQNKCCAKYWAQHVRMGKYRSCKKKHTHKTGTREKLRQLQIRQLQIRQLQIRQLQIRQLQIRHLRRRGERRKGVEYGCRIGRHDTTRVLRPHQPIGRLPGLRTHPCPYPPPY